MSSTNNNNSSNSMNSSNTKRVIPGLCYVENPGPWWVPRGLESTQGPNAKPPAYHVVSFAAEREYGPDEGWQTPRTRRQRRAMKRRAAADDGYDFDDDEY